MDLKKIALLTSGALLRGYVWWQPGNILGSTFYGMRAFRGGPGWATVAGRSLRGSCPLGWRSSVVCPRLEMVLRSPDGFSGSVSCGN